MITSWGLRNFKALQYGMELLPFGSLTIFAGANSSGKSTIIQSILMLMQTLANRDHVTLQLNGELVTLGEVEDVWFNGLLPHGDPERRLRLEMELKDAFGAEGVTLFYQLEFEPAGDTQVKLVHAQYALHDGDDYPLVLTVAGGSEGYVVESISDELIAAIREELGAQGLTDVHVAVGTRIGMDGFCPVALDVEAVRLAGGDNLRTFFIDPLHIEPNPDQLTLAIPKDVVKRLQTAAQQFDLGDLVENGGYGRARLLVKQVADYRRWYVDLAPAKKQQLSQYLALNLKDVLVSEWEWRTVSFFERLTRSVSDLFGGRIRYLSANRQPPTMLFTLNVAPHWSEVGVSGATVAAALRDHAQREIKFYDPQQQIVREATMAEALAAWLVFFRLVDGVATEDRGKLGTLLKVYVAGLDKPLDLTAVGFGVSQILPIIVQGLLTPPKSVFIVEQPEVHLHPNVQSQLAFFFFALTQVGVQCLVETHSEYIVNQLRLLLVEHPQLREQVRIYFAERDAETGTHFESVRIRANGTIANWPKGFFDEGKRLAEAMLLLAARSLE